ncbi:MAG TPA: PP2C family protein-serine/threonine phosphatase [Thermoanaerobaculia bacterium]|nr:PP2C family protein-serine/threonine phosphatase [Thermoanaerobaculia bacterium]
MSTMPAVRGLSPEVRAISRPARTFTGDFYFTHRHDDRLWLALGDVAGKGLPAAVVMAMIQEELEERIASCASAECDPARTAARLHEFLAPLLPRNRFATAVIGWLGDDGTLTLTNAGHCPPLIVRHDGTVEELSSTGPILGVLPAPSWTSTTTLLDEGDTLVLYSDGVTEAVLEEEELGVQGLRAMLAEGTPPEQLLEKLKTCDDVTLLVVRA